MENTKDNKIFFIMPAAIFLATVLALSTFTISTFAQFDAGEAGQDVQQGTGDIGFKITEGAKDLAGNIGEGVQNLGK
ncbi:MAG TPA: hypothetical protein VF242_02955 [Nitrososphaeraceae archaeon]|jgi:hypothetical protein